MLIVSLIKHIPKTQANKSNVTWECFLQTIIEFVDKQSNFAQVIEDGQGNLSL